VRSVTRPWLRDALSRVNKFLSLRVWVGLLFLFVPRACTGAPECGRT
jgi:hypothetical protein